MAMMPVVANTGCPNSPASGRSQRPLGCGQSHPKITRHRVFWLFARMRRYYPSGTGTTRHRARPRRARTGTARHPPEQTDTRRPWRSGLLIRGFGVQVPGGAPVLTCEYNQFLVSLGARNVGVGAPWVLVSQNQVGNGSECPVPVALRCVTCTRDSAGYTVDDSPGPGPRCSSVRGPRCPEGPARRGRDRDWQVARAHPAKARRPCAAERSESVPGPDEVPARYIASISQRAAPAPSALHLAQRHHSFLAQASQVPAFRYAFYGGTLWDRRAWRYCADGAGATT